MEKDNSNSQKSTLRCQVEELNQTLQEVSENLVNNAHFQTDFQNAILQLKIQQERYAEMQRILEAYSESIVSIKENTIKTEKNILFSPQNYIDLSSNSLYKKQLLDAENASEEIKYNIHKEVAQKICTEMEKHVNSILKCLNKYTKLQFFLKSHKTFGCYGIDLAGNVCTDSSITFIIDIR